MAYGGKWVLGVGVCLGVLSVAHESLAVEDERTDMVSLTLSPIHFFFPGVEVQGEVKVVDHFGAALIGGYMYAEIETVDNDGDIVDVPVNLYEVGSQLMWYPLRKFRSLELGVEVMYIYATTEKVVDVDANAEAGGLAVGPLVGFKLIAGPGFTFFIQGGVSFTVMHAEGTNSGGERATEDRSDVLPNLNLNLGWSF
jgi:hypothetical protein